MPINPTLPTDGQSDWDVPLNAALTEIVDEVNAQETDIAGKLDTSAAPELIRDTIGTALVAGTNVTITPDDGADTITISASVPGGSGDMAAAVYDPTNVADDAFDMDNMSEGTSNKILSSAERTKLSGIATGATANSSDATLLDRANHTGTQAASTIGSGTLATARLGSGTADATTYLRGDQTWATVSGSGATDLDDLTDVTIASVSDNQMLQYDSGTSQWKNEAIPLMVVDAGSNLSTARPAGATVVYWMFDFGTDPGTDGANVVNGVVGDLYYVAGA